MKAHRRHDISGRTWELLEPHLPGRAGIWGGVAEDNRLFINAILWILRTGAPWRDLEECAAAVLPLARQGDLGGVAGNAY